MCNLLQSIQCFFSSHFVRKGGEGGQWQAALTFRDARRELLQDGDEVVVLAEDDDTYSAADAPFSARILSSARAEPVAQPQRRRDVPLASDAT